MLSPWFAGLCGLSWCSFGLRVGLGLLVGASGIAHWSLSRGGFDCVLMWLMLWFWYLICWFV